MSLNLISSLSFLKNKFETAAHGGGKKRESSTKRTTTAKIDLYAGITGSDLDDSSSSSSEDDESDENTRSNAPTGPGTPAGGSTGYTTPESRLQDQDGGSKDASRPGSGPTADILQKCLDILNSDISDSETLPQPDVVKSKQGEGEGEDDEGKIDDFTKDPVKVCIIPDYSQGLLKIASPRREEGEEEGKEEMQNCTKANKSTEQKKDTFKSLSVDVNNKANSQQEQNLVEGSHSANSSPPPPYKRMRYASFSSDDDDDSSDDDLGPPELEPMVSLVKTTNQPSIVNTSATISTTQPQQSKFSIPAASIQSSQVVATSISSSQMCHIPSTVPNSFTSRSVQQHQPIPVNGSTISGLPFSQPQLPPVMPNLGQVSSGVGGIQRILLPPVPAGQAQQIIIQPPSQLPQLIQQQQSFLGPNVPTVQVLQSGQPLQYGNTLPLLTSSGQLLGSLAGVQNQNALLNNLQSFTTLLTHNSPQVIQQQQQNLINYVHNNNNQFPHFPLIAPQITNPAVAQSFPAQQILMQPKFIQQQPQPQPAAVVIKQEPTSTSQAIRPNSLTAMPQFVVVSSNSSIHQPPANSLISSQLGFQYAPQPTFSSSALSSVLQSNPSYPSSLGSIAQGQQIILPQHTLAPPNQTINPSISMQPHSINNTTNNLPVPQANPDLNGSMVTSTSALQTPSTAMTMTSNSSANISVSAGGSGSSPVAQLVQDPVTGLYNLVSTHLPVPSSTTSSSSLTNTPLSRKLSSTPVSIPGISSSPLPMPGLCSSTPVSFPGFSGAPFSIPGLTKSPVPLHALTSTPTSIVVTPDIKPTLPIGSPMLNRSSTPISSCSSPSKLLPKNLIPSSFNISFNSKENNKPAAQKASTTDNQLTTKFKCGVCNKYFGNTKNLRVHISEIHEGKRGQFPCDICHKVFPRKRNMERHKNALHLKNHPVCPLCQKAVVNIDVHVKRFHRGSQDHKKVSAATA